MPNPQSKRCPKCDQPKPIEDFHKNRARKDGRQSICKTCMNKATRLWARTNPGAKAVQKAIRRKNISRNRQFVLTYLLNHPCVDCGEDDPVVLDFDHVTGKKKFGIADLLRATYSLQTIETEIAKCVVRCANCHRKKTAREQGCWFKSRAA